MSTKSEWLRRLACRLGGHRLPGPPLENVPWMCARCGFGFCWRTFVRTGKWIEWKRETTKGEKP